MYRTVARCKLHFKYCSRLKPITMMKFKNVLTAFALVRAASAFADGVEPLLLKDFARATVFFRVQNRTLDPFRQSERCF